MPYTKAGKSYKTYLNGRVALRTIPLKWWLRRVASTRTYRLPVLEKVFRVRAYCRPQPFEWSKYIDQLRYSAPEKKIIVEAGTIIAAGGINLSNVEEYAATGISVLVTSAPYCAKPADIQVKIEVV